MANWDWTENYGTIKRLYPDRDGQTFFQLTGGKTAMNPTNGYYYLTINSNSNYPALLDLLYLAAEHQWTIYARTEDQLDPNGHGHTVYLVVDF